MGLLLIAAPKAAMSAVVGRAGNTAPRCRSRRALPSSLPIGRRGPEQHSGPTPQDAPPTRPCRQGLRTVRATTARERRPAQALVARRCRWCSGPWRQDSWRRLLDPFQDDTDVTVAECIVAPDLTDGHQRCSDCNSALIRGRDVFGAIEFGTTGAAGGDAGPEAHGTTPPSS